MAEDASYFQEGGIAYARWAAADWKASSPTCPYPEHGEAARGWRCGFRYWFYKDYGSPRIWTEEAIERIRTLPIPTARATGRATSAT